MYGWKLLAVVALVLALVVGSADPTLAQTPVPTSGTVVAAPAPGHVPMAGNPCCTPCGYVMNPCGGMAMGYPGAPMMSSSAYTPQPRFRLFNRSTPLFARSSPTVAPPMGTYLPATTSTVAVAPTVMPGTAVTGTVATTTPSTITPTTGTTTTTPATATTTGTTPAPLTTVPPGYFVTVNGQLVPTAGSSFYPMEPVQYETPRRMFRLFRR